MTSALALNLSPRRRARLLVALVAVVLPLGFLAPLLVGGRALVRDDASLFGYPQFISHHRSLAEGHLYLWDPAHFGGLAVMPAAQGGTLYPPYLLLYRLLNWLDATHLAYWLHLALALGGAAWLARRLGLSLGGAILAAAIYTYSGYQAAHFLHYNFVAGLAHLPLMVVLLDLALRRGGARYWLLWALEVAVAVYGGQPQVIFMALVVCALWLVGGGWWGEQAGPPLLLRRLPALLGAAGVAALLVMPQVLTTLELLRLGQEVAGSAAGGGAEFMASYPFRATDLARVLLANLLGGVNDCVTGGGPTYHETAAYLGLAPVLLALAGIVTSRGRRGQGFLWALLIVGGLLMWTAGNPLYGLLQQVPFLRDFRAMGRWALLPTLAVALWCGQAVNGLSALPPHRRLQARQIMAVGTGLLLLLWGLLWLTFGAEGSRFALPGQPHLALPPTTPAAAIYNFHVGWEPLWLLGSLALTLVAYHGLSRGGRWRRWLLAALLVGLLAPLWPFWQMMNPTVPRAYYEDPPYTARAILQDGGGRIVYLPAALVDPTNTAANRPPPPGWSPAELHRASLPPGLGLAWGLRYADGYVHRFATPAPYRLWQDWLRYSVQTFTGEVTTSAATLAEVGTAAERMKRCHRLLAAQYIVTTGELDDPDLPVLAEGPVRVYRYREDHPRAWLVSAARTIPEPEAQLRALKLRTFDPGREAIIDGDAPGLTGDPDPGGVAIVHEDTLQVTLQAHCRRPAVLVLADAWYPGWTVRVNGRPAPLLRCNFATRAVALPAGSHEVTFAFRSATWARGLWLLGLGIIVALGALIIDRQRNGDSQG